MIRLISCLFIALGLGHAAIAQEVPGLFEVTGVEMDDTLNVRTGPGVDFDVIGELAPFATEIEVTDIDFASGWGRINFQEQTGWVSMRFMAELPLNRVGGLPRPIICFGTEPFWDFEIRGDGSTALQLFGEHVARFPVTNMAEPRNLVGRVGVVAESVDGNMSAIVAQRSCSDGMSDRTYGYAVDMILNLSDNPEVYSGCCSVGAVFE